jgi:hypothetical protein
MNIYTIRDNLKNTIAGKEEMIVDKTWLAESPYAGDIRRAADMAAVEFLKINLNELKRILDDVEMCCAQFTESSWESNPDRMGR